MKSDAILTDLYELTMAAGYFEHGIQSRATFELFIRSLPPQRGFALACGLESALDFLENLRFTEAEIGFLRRLPAFQNISPAFFESLGQLRFTGDVMAVPEGTVIFAREPLLEITGPIAEAQIVETYLLSVVNFETLVATKAARVVRAAGGKDVFEFGTRRAQGPEAGVRAARAAYVGGCAATSNVLAGSLYGVPLAGTAAHSWTQAFSSERESFEALLDSFPNTGILLLDTYDPLNAAAIAGSLKRKVPGVRLDSGDLANESRSVRQILDRAGHAETRIVASGDLNEYRVRDLVAAGAPIDAFGVGTELATSKDAPALSVVYKLVEMEGNGNVEFKAKLSPHKAYPPGRKQVFRICGNGDYERDIIGLAKESYPDAIPLLQPAMRHGQRLGRRPTLEEIQGRAAESLSHLPPEYQSLEMAAHYPVEESRMLRELTDEVRESVLRKEP